MASEGMTEKQVVEELRRGNRAVFRQLVESHQTKVLNICYRFVHSREEAEDLAQETFLEVHRSISGFRGGSSLGTWIHRIAVSKSLDFVRKQGRKKRRGLFGKPVSLDESTEQVPAPRSTVPDVQLEMRERRRVLQTALESLPERQRVAFVLSKYDGMSYQEIAQLLKTSLSSVESLIHRAKNNLQKKLRRYYEQEM